MTKLTKKAQLSFNYHVIRSDARGFARLSRLHNELRNFSDTEIRLDCSTLSWLDGHLTAPLRIVLRQTEKRGNFVKMEGMQPKVVNVLRKNRFLNERLDDTYRTTMPMTEFALEQGVSFSLFAKKHLARKKMPKMTKSLRSKFFEGVDELFANSALHSKSAIGVAVCGQFFPANQVLDFAIADGGRTIACHFAFDVNVERIVARAQGTATEILRRRRV